ncbi:hypothetical protein ACQ33O_13525 [Ferruginibacter sp. SUN002]|uniref:hypothetical protein n=1 Tax=Ferruginibacter sp. SUN002 TaxID=2937789 RepID=UPI003D36B396
MKKIIGLLSLAIGFTAMSCTNESTEPKKDVIVVPVTTPPKKEVIIVPATPTPDKGTSVTLDKGGVKVEVKK